jgi:predicted tellurium resistance membrane protein TerC
MNALTMLATYLNKKEPVAYAMVLAFVAFTAYKVIVEKMPIGEVMTEEYMTYAMGLWAALLARLNVYAPATVDGLQERALADASAQRTEEMAGE